MVSWSKPYQRGPDGQERELIPRMGVVGGKIIGVWIEPEKEAREDQPIMTPLGANEVPPED